MTRNNELFQKAWDKYCEHPETGHERIIRLAREKFGIEMMSIASLDVIKSMTSYNPSTGKFDISYIDALEQVDKMSDSDITMLIANFVVNHTGEKTMPGIILTEKAVKEINNIIKDQELDPEKTYFRARVCGGGCSGFITKLDLDEEVDEKKDQLTEQNGIKIAIDKRSLLYIDGSTIDFVDNHLDKRGFIVDNPRPCPNVDAAVLSACRRHMKNFWLDRKDHMTPDEQSIVECLFYNIVKEAKRDDKMVLIQVENAQGCSIEIGRGAFSSHLQNWWIS